MGTMQKPSPLTRLIWDFYRENPEELIQLGLLGQCKLFRRWGVLHIQCLTPEMGEAVIELYNLIKEPISQMRLAPKIKISVKNTEIAIFCVKSEQIIA